MIKVLQINACDSTASTGTVMRDIQDVCLHSGLECHIAYATTERSRHDILKGYHIGCWLDHKMHALLSRIIKRQGAASTLPTLHLIRHIDKIKPDVIHLHNLHANYVNLNLLLKAIAKRDIATVITLHDNWFFTGGCCLPELLHCRGWEEGCRSCRHISAACKVFEDRKKYFNAVPRLAVVGVSDWMNAEAARSFLKGRPIATVRNGVRTDVFRPLTPESRALVRSSYGIKDGEYLILGPASKWLQASNRKGLDTIVKSLKADERLFLYGCTPRQMKAIQNEKITLIPFTPHKPVLATIYSMADLFINCTHMDTCSFINIESQACGTPVITFDNTGASETVDGKCGFRVATDDYDALSREIARVRGLAIDPESPRQWVEDRFSMVRNYRGYVEVYESIDIMKLPR